MLYLSNIDLEWIAVKQIISKYNQYIESNIFSMIYIETYNYFDIIKSYIKGYNFDKKALCLVNEDKGGVTTEVEYYGDWLGWLKNTVHFSKTV